MRKMLEKKKSSTNKANMQVSLTEDGGIYELHALRRKRTTIKRAKDVFNSDSDWYWKLLNKIKQLGITKVYLKDVIIFDKFECFLII